MGSSRRTTSVAKEKMHATLMSALGYRQAFAGVCVQSSPSCVSANCAARRISALSTRPDLTGMLRAYVSATVRSGTINVLGAQLLRISKRTLCTKRAVSVNSRSPLSGYMSKAIFEQRRLPERSRPPKPESSPGIRLRSNGQSCTPGNALLIQWRSLATVM